MSFDRDFTRSVVVAMGVPVVTAFVSFVAGFVAGAFLYGRGP